MKPGYLLLLFFCSCSLNLIAQTPSDSLMRAIDSAEQRMIEGEKRAALPLFDQKAAGTLGFSAASGNFHVNFYRCEWTVDPAIRYITGKVTSHFTALSSTSSITVDLSDTLSVDSITYHASRISFQRPGNDALTLQFPVTLNAGRLDSVSIYYQGTPRANTGFGAFSQTTHNGAPVIWTLSEPYGAREWWPCNNGLTDKADSLDMIITCPAAYHSTGNGMPVSDSVTAGVRTVYLKHRYPIASYLVAFAATNFTVDSDSVLIGNKIMPVVMNSYPEWESYFQTATSVAKNCLSYFSSLFGDYPFVNERYSQTEVSISGGMEHQTNSFISSNSDQLVGHELCHHWFGDRVTCGSWQDIWLNEGFGNYSQFLVVQRYDASLIKAHLQYYTGVVVAVPDGSVFVDDTTNVNRIFSARLTYAKGGYCLHMLRGILGDSVFFRGLRQYLNDPRIKYGFARTADLERNLEQASGKNLQTFFQKWIYGQGWPSYSATWMQNNNNWVKVQINQTTSHPSVSFYDMPVQLRFMNAHGDTALITVNHQQSGQVFWINPGFKADTMALDPDMWILTNSRTVQQLPPQSTIANDLKIYPNPAPDHVYISLSNPVSPNLYMELYNAAGQLLYKTQTALTGQDVLIAIPTSQLARGIYVLKVTDNQNLKMTKKLLK